MTALLDHPTAAAAPAGPLPLTAPPPPGDVHGDPPKLTHDQLAVAHQQTLTTPRRRYSLAARLLFLTMDLVYGRTGTLSKYRVLEVVARVPYQTWESVTYKQITRRYDRVTLVRRLWMRVHEFRAQQDNEQWHLLLLDELVAAYGRREGRLRYALLPRLIALGYWHFCWLLYVLRPAWSHRLNADFEDHAEHEYAEFVEAHPELDRLEWSTAECAEYGAYASVGDLLRQVMHDERCHKQESERHLSGQR